MCGGIKFIFERSEDGLEQTARVFISQPVKRKIPVIHKGKKWLIQWGRREGEQIKTRMSRKRVRRDWINSIPNIDKSISQNSCKYRL